MTGVREGAAGSPTFAKLARESKRVTIQGRDLYVVEGDLLLDESQLAQYALRKEAGEDEDEAIVQEPTDNGPAKLLGISVEGKKLRWQPGKILSYYIAKESFPKTEMYQTVRDHIREATEAWMNTCGIRFEYQAALDDNPANRASALFGVSYLDANGQFIAAAFFPDDPPDRRVVVIDPSYFSPNLGFDRTGVL